MKRYIYLDHNATTRRRPEVVEAMLPHLTYKLNKLTNFIRSKLGKEQGHVPGEAVAAAFLLSFLMCVGGLASLLISILFYVYATQATLQSPLRFAIWGPMILCASIYIFVNLSFGRGMFPGDKKIWWPILIAPYSICVYMMSKRLKVENALKARVVRALLNGIIISLVSTYILVLLPTAQNNQAWALRVFVVFIIPIVLCVALAVSRSRSRSMSAKDGMPV